MIWSMEIEFVQQIVAIFRYWCCHQIRFKMSRWRKSCLNFHCKFLFRSSWKILKINSQDIPWQEDGYHAWPPTENISIPKKMGIMFDFPLLFRSSWKKIVKIFPDKKLVITLDLPSTTHPSEQHQQEFSKKEFLLKDLNNRNRICSTNCCHFQILMLPQN